MVPGKYHKAKYKGLVI